SRPRSSSRTGSSRSGRGMAVVASEPLGYLTGGKHLPNATGILLCQGRVDWTRKRLGELGHVDDQAVDPVTARRVLVGLGMQAQVLRALVLAGPLRIAHEEALLGREAVAPGQRLVRALHTPGHVSQDQAAEIGDVLTQGETAVDVDVVNDHVFRVLVDDALGAFVELLGVLIAPPVFQIPCRIELAPLIVKAVRQLMTDGAAGIAVVRG